MRRLELALAAGLLPALLAGIQSWALGIQPSLGAALISQSPPWLFWALGAQVVASVGERYPLARRRLAAHLVIHLVTLAVLALVHAVFATYVWGMLNPPPGAEHHGFVETVWLVAKKLSLLDALVYGCILAAVQARTWRVAAGELEVRLARAQLEALRAQLQPHFLFNTLNAVSVLVRKGDDKAAVQAIADLGRLLRVTLEAGPEQEFLLDAELAFVTGYLELEKLRFGDKLEVRLDVEPEARAARVPSFVLQPLVENALQHGHCGVVELGAHRRGDRLELTVRDDGVGPKAGWTEGVGLGNLRQRLDRLYPGVATLALSAAPGRGAIARVVIPWPWRRE